MSFRMKYSPAIDAAGDSVVGCAKSIKQAGEDMYTHLMNLCESGQLRGEGIEQALRESHARWNAACDDFARAEQEFGTKCKDSYANMMATDLRCAGNFQAA